MLIPSHSHPTFGLLSRHRNAPKLLDSTPSHTNCVVTAYWADGKKRTPPILFTHNPAFQTEEEWKIAPDGRRRNITPTRKAKIDEFNKYMKEYGIESYQVVYLHNGQSAYCKESQEVITRYFQSFDRKMFRGSNVFHDAGTAMRSSIPVLSGLRYNFTRTEYPPMVHEILSPNDNKAHGIAKKIWRTSGLNRSSDVQSSLYLLKLLNDIDPEVIKGCFNENFAIGVEEEDLKEKCVQLTGYNPLANDDKIAWSAKVLPIYSEWESKKHKRGTNVTCVNPDSHLCSLDGVYWNSYAE